MEGEYNMLLHKGTVKRVLCVLMACVLMLAPATPVSAATARATTMKLEKKVGTVTLKTQSGTSLRITDGMRLYNGNSLATEKYSYAYISLDSSKAVKLDQSSSATLRQNGRSLELLVKSGKLFFNVDKPLGQDESMNVRTSTMVTGIRGTCGVVEVVSQRQSKLYLIEGEVTLGTGDQAVAVRGGQIATVELGSGSGTPAKPGDADPDAKQAVQVGKMTEKDIPSVALEEIMNDSALQKKIEQTTDLDMEKIREAYEQFKKEEAGQNDPGKTDQDQKDDQKEDTKKDDKKDDNTSGSSSGGSSSGGSSGGSSTPSQPVEKEINLNGIVTSGAIEAAFAKRDKVHIGYGTGDATLQLVSGETLTVPTGKELLIWGKQDISSNSEIKVEKGGLLCVPDGASLGGEGRVHLTEGSTLEVHGTLCTDLISDGGAAIKNTNTIRGNYVAATADKYQGYSGVLISEEPLDSLPQADWLLMTSESKQDRGYYYAKYICRAVVEAIAALPGNSVRWNFANNAVIPAGDVVSLSNFHVQMNDKELWIEGSLTLDGNTEIAGTGQRVIHLNGGTLKLGGSDHGSIVNRNGGYAISHEAGSLIWSNKNVRLVVEAPDMGGETDDNKTARIPYTLQGIQFDAQTLEITKPDYVTLSEGSSLQWNPFHNELRYWPSDFQNPDEKVGEDQIVNSLAHSPIMTIGEKVYGELVDKSVVIPDGKLLRIQSKKDAGGGFLLATGASIVIGANATLQIEGDLWGAGKIIILEGGKLVVAKGASVEIQSIEGEKEQIQNDGGEIKLTEGIHHEP